jgi:hypothetical protein
MTDPKEYLMRLENWGNWSRVDRGEPPGFPTEAAFTRMAKKSEWDEDGWAEFDINGKPLDKAKQETAVFSIYEKDAIAVNAIIEKMQFAFKYLLRDKYVKCDPHVFHFRRYADEAAYTIQAEEHFARLMRPFPSGKQKVIELLEQKWRTKDM